MTASTILARFTPDLTGQVAKEIEPYVQHESAYELTKRILPILDRMHMRWPAWPTIRSIIGKGSSNDILRALRDAEAENVMRRTAHHQMGLPPEVAEWARHGMEIAHAAARREFDGERQAFATREQELHEQVATLRTRADDTARALEAAQAEVVARAGELASAREIAQSLQAQLAAEQQAKTAILHEAGEARAAGTRALEEVQRATAATADAFQGSLRRAEEAYKGLEARSHHEVDAARQATKAAEARAATLATELRGKAAEVSIATAEVSRLRKDLERLQKELSRKKPAAAVATTRGKKSPKTAAATAARTPAPRPKKKALPAPKRRPAKK